MLVFDSCSAERSSVPRLGIAVDHLCNGLRLGLREVELRLAKVI